MIDEMHKNILIYKRVSRLNFFQIDIPTWTSLSSKVVLYLNNVSAKVDNCCGWLVSIEETNSTHFYDKMWEHYVTSDTEWRYEMF